MENILTLCLTAWTSGPGKTYNVSQIDAHCKFCNHFNHASILLVRCAVNATPQKMSDAAVQLERFVCSIASNKKERKSVRAVIFEVINLTCLFESGFRYQKCILFTFSALYFCFYALICRDHWILRCPLDRLLTVTLSPYVYPYSGALFSLHYTARVYAALYFNSHPHFGF